MKASNLRRTRTLGPVALGIVATALSVGCGSSGPTGPNGGEQTGSSQAADITPLSLTTGGCNAVGTFGITSSQVISFIVANTANFQNAQLQLFQMNSQNQLTQVNVTAQQASAQMQAMVQAWSSANASQDAKLSQSSNNTSNSSAATNAFTMQHDQTTITGSQSQFADNDSTVFHSDQHNTRSDGSQSNSASASSSATQSASGNNGSSSSANQNFQNAAFQSGLVAGFFGGIVTIPTFSSSSASGSNSASAINNAFFTNAAAAAQNASAAQNSSFANATHSDNQSLGKTDTSTASGSKFSQTVTNDLNANNGTSASNSAANSASLKSEQSSDANQNANSNNLQQSSSSSSSKTLAFSNLQQLNSSNLVLVVKVTASQANNVLQLFQGSNGVVTGGQSFPITIPTCGVGTPVISADAPTITPVSLPASFN